MRARNKNETFLINIFYILNLNVNFLLDKYICQKKLYKEFDKNSI